MLSRKARALFSGHATWLIFVSNIDWTLSAISVPARCHMRPTHRATRGQATKQAMGKGKHSMETAIIEDLSPVE